MCSAQHGFFFSSLISCFPDMLLRYCLSDFEMVPVDTLITVSTFEHSIRPEFIIIIIIIIIISTIGRLSVDSAR